MAAISETKATKLDHLLADKPVKNRVYRVGVELEGAWKKIPEGAALTHDGSVMFDEDENVTTRRPANVNEDDPTVPPTPQRLRIGELVSPPLEVSKIYPWIRQNYPSKINNTCGLHVHMSFRSTAHYQRLMEASYPVTMVMYLTKWAKDDEGFNKNHIIWKRLSGKNEYCRQQFFPDLQASKTTKEYAHEREGHRYTVINYCHSLHGTLECRVLPMFETADTSVRAVKNVINITNAWLIATAKREYRLRTDGEGFENDPLQEESEEFV